MNLGIVITGTQIKETVAKTIAANKEQIVAERYAAPLSNLFSEVRDALKWGDGKLVKEEFDKQILDLLGPKTDEDMKARSKVFPLLFLFLFWSYWVNLNYKKMKSKKKEEDKSKGKAKDQAPESEGFFFSFSKLSVPYAQTPIDQRELFSRGASPNEAIRGGGL